MIQYKGFQVPNVHELAQENKISDIGNFILTLDNKELNLHAEFDCTVSRDEYNMDMAYDGDKRKEERISFLNSLIMCAASEYISNSIWKIKSKQPDSEFAAIIKQHEDNGDWPVTELSKDGSCTWVRDYENYILK